MIIVHMEQRETHEKDCNNSKHCNRDKDQRKGLFDRIRGMLGLDEEEEIREYSTRSSDFRTNINLEASTQEECASIGGIWNEERSVC